MFSYLSKNIKRKTLLIIIPILAVYLCFILFFYTSFLQNDYINKATHISQKMEEHISLQVQMIEESIAIQNRNVDAEATKDTAGLFSVFRSVLTSNANVQDAFFYDGSRAVYYTPVTKRKFQNYVEAAQKMIENVQTNQWVLVQTAGDNSSLVYSYVVTQKNEVKGCFGFEIDSSLFMKMLDTYDNYFTKDAAIILKSSEENYLVLKSSNYLEDLLEKYKFSEENVERASMSAYSCSRPLLAENLCVQVQFSLGNVLKNSLVIALVLIFILLMTGVLCYLSIDRYSKNLSERLEYLAKRIKELPDN